MDITHIIITLKKLLNKTLLPGRFSIFVIQATRWCQKVATLEHALKVENGTECLQNVNVSKLSRILRLFEKSFSQKINTFKYLELQNSMNISVWKGKVPMPENNDFIYGVPSLVFRFRINPIIVVYTKKEFVI